MTREQIYTAQLQELGIYEKAFDPVIKDLAKAERRRTRVEKAWSASAPKGGKPDFTDPLYAIIERLDRKILIYREALGLTPLSLKRLRNGSVSDAPIKQDLISERLSAIERRVNSYELPAMSSLDIRESPDE